jgi:hypothetical protein
MDIAEVQTAEGKLYLFVGIDRTSKFAVTQLVDKADRRTAWEFLEHLLKAVPYPIHTILTDNPVLSEVEGGHSIRRAAAQPKHRLVASDALRHDLRSKRHRAPLDQAEPPVDQRSGRANEPHHQGGNGQTLPLRKPRAVAGAPRRLHGSL